MPSGGGDSWWRSAAIYQLYVRSFADGNGDGIGDLAGRPGPPAYLADLGIDAIWFNPWYPSPMSDAGYDISDYRAIDPVFGTLADADALIAEAHAHGHQDHHRRGAQPRAPTSIRGSPPRWRPGRGRRSGTGSGSGRAAVRPATQPPNNWQSIFGGPAWTRVTEPDGSPGEWYLHLFAPRAAGLQLGQSPDVRREFEDVLRFWFDRGVDGIRIDSARAATKDPPLPDVGR